MGKVYKFSDRKGGFIFTNKEGYNVVLPEMIGRAYENVRGNKVSVFIAGKLTYTSEFCEIVKGYVPLKKEDGEKTVDVAKLLMAQNNLKSMLEDHKTIALSDIKRFPDYYLYREEKNAILFVKCDGGVMGSGWYGEPESSKKGLMMCAFILYALGFINAGNDAVLWESTYRYLLYETNLGVPEKYDSIILNALEDKVANKNNLPWPK